MAVARIIEHQNLGHGAPRSVDWSPVGVKVRPCLLLTIRISWKDCSYLVTNGGQMDRLTAMRTFREVVAAQVSQPPRGGSVSRRRRSASMWRGWRSGWGPPAAAHDAAAVADGDRPRLRDACASWSRSRGRGAEVRNSQRHGGARSRAGQCRRVVRRACVGAIQARHPNCGWRCSSTTARSI